MRRHFTAVSSLLAGLMRWAVCLQTRISCLSSVRRGHVNNRIQTDLTRLCAAGLWVKALTAGADWEDIKMFTVNMLGVTYRD